MTSERDELITIQKRLVEELKENLYNTLVRRDSALDQYYREYQQEFKQGFDRLSSRNELVQRLMRAEIAYFGDYHTLRAAQSTVLDLLTAACERGRKVVLAVEMLHAADKKHSQDFIDGEIDAETFRWRVDWDRSWGFPWASYQRFFDFAEQHDVPMFGLNINADYEEGGLRYRDRFASELVSSLAHLYPERLIVVMYGDLHLSTGHLPKEVDKRLAEYGAQRRNMIVYQNSETLYWKLVEQRLEHVVDYLKLRRDTYVVMNATPLVKFQSYANWQRRRTELTFDSDNYEMDLLGDSVLLDTVHEYVRTIVEFLGIELEQTADFEVYTAADLDLLSKFVKRGVYTADEMEALKGYIEMAESAYFERAGVIYLGNFTVANAAEAAARYVLAKLRPSSTDPVDSRDEFYARVMVEALAYFCSKIVDPRRHARDENEWAAVKTQFARRRKLTLIQKLDVQVAKGFLRHKEYEKKVKANGAYGRAPTSLFGRPTEEHVALTRALGRALGDRLYAALGGQLTKDQIREAMHDDIRKPERSRQRYFELMELTENVEIDRSHSRQLPAVDPSND